MNNDQLFDGFSKVAKFLYKEFTLKLDDVSIIQHDNGNYEVFNKYIIKPHEGMFTIEMHETFVKKTFGSLKNSLIWCIYDHRNRINRAQRIEELDRILSGINLNVQMQERLIKKYIDSPSRSIHEAKLQEEKRKKKWITHELEQYVRDADSWQSKKFTAKINTK